MLHDSALYKFMIDIDIDIDLAVQWTDRTFVVAGDMEPRLPSTVRNASSVNGFKKALKTFLFANLMPRPTVF